MDPQWIDVDKGYSLSLQDGKLRCRNAKGKVLASVPAAVRKSDAGQQLLALRDWMAEHKAACQEQVERWMLRSLPVPGKLIAAVWHDPVWQAQLRDLVVHPEGHPESAGLLRGAESGRGIGVVDLDGESMWLDAEQVFISHPVLLEELDDWRELAGELGVSQGVAQLHRETTAKPDEVEGNRILDYADGRFEELRHAQGRCRTVGVRVSGGFAVCPIWEDGAVIEARYWIGSHDPEGETETGELLFVDAQQRVVPLADVPPVAWSEGHRMAARIFAGRVIKEETSP